MEETGEDILASGVYDVALSEASLKRNEPRGVEAAFSLAERGLISVGAGGAAINIGNVIGRGSSVSVGNGTVIDPRFIERPRRTGLLSGRFGDTKLPGSYTVQVTAAGFSPACKSRFVRHDLLSVVVVERG